MAPESEVRQLLTQADGLTHCPTFRELSLGIQATVVAFRNDLVRLTTPHDPTPRPEDGFYEPHGIT
jgi:hypothetical protein